MKSLTRALRLRCPHCGGGPIFVTWSRLVPNCPVCGLGLERGEQGYWVGAYFFNLMGVETVFSVWFVGFLYFTWPSPPWEFFQVSTLAIMLVFPIFFFPYSKTLFLAFDLFVRPPGEEDFAVPHEHARRRKHAGQSPLTPPGGRPPDPPASPAGRAPGSRPAPPQ